MSRETELKPSIHPNLLRDETSEWEVQTSDIDGNPVVTCHTRVIGGVLCRWWGDEAPPSGVELIDQASAIKVVTRDGETGPNGPEDAQARIERAVREIEIICDEFGFDPVQWLMPDLENDVPPQSDSAETPAQRYRHVDTCMANPTTPIGDASCSCLCIHGQRVDTTCDDCIAHARGTSEGSP